MITNFALQKDPNRNEVSFQKESLCVLFRFEETLALMDFQIALKLKLHLFVCGNFQK